jgi:AcrR family transcriptional regulator
LHQKYKPLAKEKVNTSTEEKIKQAAKKVFMQKGYAASRTRDIAEAAGINLALLNYYFRSKEKLFDIIMLENLQQFIEGIKEILINKETSFELKMEAVASKYIELMTQLQDLH